MINKTERNSTKQNRTQQNMTRAHTIQYLNTVAGNNAAVLLVSAPGLEQLSKMKKDVSKNAYSTVLTSSGQMNIHHIYPD